MNFKYSLNLLAFLVCLNSVSSQTKAGQLENILKEQLVSEYEVRSEHHDYIKKRITKLKLPPTAKQWQEEAQVLRERVLENIIFRGVPSSWRTFKPNVVLSDIIQGDGYTVQKLRYEAVPGFWVPALLYIPESVAKNPGKKIPVVLNVNGHDGQGKAVDYKQRRCIHLAKHGVLSLNVEWLGMGQFKKHNYGHPGLYKMDLCGCSGLSLFYLMMSRGLDVLLDQTEADQKNVAVTGLSGGGWQTIIISSLDTRVTCCIPVAGYAPLISRLERDSDIGDHEQIPVDLISIADYTHLTAMLVPRPTLLIYNAKDNCCFVSKFVKPVTYDPIIPFYRQAGVPENFQYYENVDPGTHNYRLDNRNQFYQFLNRHFFDGEKVIPVEKKDSKGVLKYEELLVDIPEKNGGFNVFSMELAKSLPVKNKMSVEQKRDQLKEILRIKNRQAEISKIDAKKLESGETLMQLTVSLDQELRIPVVVITPKGSTRTILLMSDDGYETLAIQVRKLLNGKIQVVLCDPIFIGQNNVKGNLYQQELLMNTVGERPLGIQAEQVLQTVRSLTEVLVSKKVEVHGLGMRSSLIALCASAIDENDQLSATVSKDFPESLKYFLKPEIKTNLYPEFYTFGLLKHFDVSDLKQLAN